MSVAATATQRKWSFTIRMNRSEKIGFVPVTEILIAGLMLPPKVPFWNPDQTFSRAINPMEKGPFEISLYWIGYPGFKMSTCLLSPKGFKLRYCMEENSAPSRTWTCALEINRPLPLELLPFISLEFQAKAEIFSQIIVFVCGHRPKTYELLELLLFLFFSVCLITSINWATATLIH